MDRVDRAIVNRLQDGIAVIDRPFAPLAAELAIGEDDLIARVGVLLEQGVLSRFGPMIQAERLGGAFTLAALAVAEEDFDRVTAIVNACPEVAHNYRREHALNMWFVLATETPEEIGEIIARIERATGLPVVNLPKEAEYFIGLKLALH